LEPAVKKPTAHDRHEERAELARLFQTGASVQMLAPRRIGKTWLMHKVADDLEAEGWLCIRVDVEGMRTEEEFLRALCAEIEKNQVISKRVFAHVLQRVQQLTGGAFNGTLVQTIGQIDSKQFSETLIESLNASDMKSLILIDEISLFVMERAKQDVDGTRTLLYHLRKLRQKYENVVWLFTGSIGLDVVSRDLTLAGALIGLDTFPLEPFTQDAAHSFIEELCIDSQLRQPYDFGPGAFEFLARELGWLSPYYLKHIAQLISAEHTGRRRQTWDRERSGCRERVRRITQAGIAAEQRARLRAILDVLCENVEGEIEATLLARVTAPLANMPRREFVNLLTVLANDGFIEKFDERWRFRSGLLRRYWVEYMKA